MSISTLFLPIESRLSTVVFQRLPDHTLFSETPCPWVMSILSLAVHPGSQVVRVVAPKPTRSSSVVREVAPKADKESVLRTQRRQATSIG